MFDLQLKSFCVCFCLNKILVLLYLYNVSVKRSLFLSTGLLTYCLTKFVKINIFLKDEVALGLA